MQVTLESKFDNQSGYVKMTYDFVSGETYKRCQRCRRKKKLSKFDDSKESKDKKSATCIKCKVRERTRTNRYNKNHRKRAKEYSHEYYQDTKHRESAKVWQCLYGESRRGPTGILHGTGFCMLCDYLDPRGFENHHVIPHIDNDDDFMITLCASCHKIHHGGASQEKHMRSIQNAIEKSKRLWNE